MENRDWIVPLCFAVMMCFASNAWPQTPPKQSVQQPLIAAGSGVNLGITRLLAKAYMADYPDAAIEIPGSIGSKGAIAAVADGSITFGLLSRPLKEKEQSSRLVALPYARVPMVVGAHPSVQDDGITFQELVDIYRGTKTCWKNGAEIVVQTREPFDSGFQVLEAKIPGFREAYAESRRARLWTIYFTDQDANRALSNTSHAIGVSDLGMIATEHLDIKVLKLNGIVPGPETLLSGKYTLSRDLFFLYREETLTKESEAFLDYVFSEKGEMILRSNGYLPL
ncbi:MAG: substrate-binding domain-containing protein, partial [Syntrophobacteraceae bacterium]